LLVAICEFLYVTLFCSFLLISMHVAILFRTSLSLDIARITLRYAIKGLRAGYIEISHGEEELHQERSN
jgi:hypothetical protein